LARVFTARSVVSISDMPAASSAANTRIVQKDIPSVAAIPSTPTVAVSNPRDVGGVS